MSPRSIRRAIERKQRKQALKALRNQEPATLAEETFSPEEDLSAAEDHAAPSEYSNYSLEPEEADQTLTAPELQDVIEEVADEEIVAATLTQQTDEGSTTQLPRNLPPTEPTRRTLANRANAQHSTGPVTPAGKSKVRLNALKTGLTGRTVLLPADDVAIYQSVIADFVARYKPANDEERALVQSLADHEWRLRRIPQLEYAIFSLAHREFQAEFAAEPENCRQALSEVTALLKYSRELETIFRHEARLSRMRERDEKRLLRIQGERRGAENRARQAAAQASNAAPIRSPYGQPPSRNGFEFSPVRTFPSQAAPRSPMKPSQHESLSRKGEERASATGKSR
jgi:hypothetical protein